MRADIRTILLAALASLGLLTATVDYLSGRAQAHPSHEHKDKSDGHIHNGH